MKGEDDGQYSKEVSGEQDERKRWKEELEGYKQGEMKENEGATGN